MLRELLPPDTGLAYPAMAQLRPHLESEAGFVRQVDEDQRPGGYRLVAVLPGPGLPALSVAGFRLGTSLSWGRHVYVDDLVTTPEARGQGHAARLLEWIVGEASGLGCKEVHLDSAVGEARADAHRLYLNHGFRIVAHHFRRDL